MANEIETLVAQEHTQLAAQAAAATVARSGTAAGLTNDGTIGQANRHSTVLPEVRSTGSEVELVPREQARYENHKVLGRGGMGEVKLAEDHDIGRKVAIKRMLGNADPHTVARFVDEVRTVGRLEHPNIVPIHDVGVDRDGSLFFVMKYVDGETLSSIIEKLQAGDPEAHARYSYEHRLELFAALCRALAYAHSRGLVHRDIKPDNVMVGAYGEVILMDWGIVHRVRAEAGPVRAAASDLPERAAGETIDGEIIGTPQYMSPEQARGEVAKLDGRSDLYSAFVLLFELLTLRPYIEGGQPALQTICAVQECSPPGSYDPVYTHPQQVQPVPVELRHFVQHGLAPEPGARFQSAEEVLHSLEAVRAGDFAVQCAVTLIKKQNTKMERFMDRFPRGSVLLAAFCAVIVLGGLAGWLAWAGTVFGG